ncbi:cohesin domain-containing protein [Desulfobotulus sp. H1]|uniref:Cohesin domain-containing protein n=1 Tax=Desulfobotulus pelophilus TaxID=2823377 RepID=A0ABT3N5Q9_9BACT|nr:cohesin domain-containing protein [Desulfobotulus pelophilus]MCW7752795.1 cohesin domain-containing protein [Desulfobotulus pelophilus]
MRYPVLTFFFCCLLALPCQAKDIFLTPFHGKSGGTADTWVLIKDARNNLEVFSFVLAYDSAVLSFQSIPEGPGWGWTINHETLLRKDGKERIRLTFQTNNTDHILTKDQDYLLARVRFAVHRDRTTDIELQDPEGDISISWDRSGARFFYTDQSHSGGSDDSDNSVNISCFMDSLIR